MIEVAEISDNHYKEIKNLYEKAKSSGDKSFEFNGQELLTEYAKYLLQYYELKINIKQNL